MKINPYILAIVIICITNYACKGKETKQNHLDDTKNKTAILLDKDTSNLNEQSNIFPQKALDLIEDAIGEQVDVRALDSLQNGVDKNIPPLLDDFYNLKMQGLYKEALSIYEDNTGDILVYLKTTTDKYQFLLEVVDLYNKLYNDETALGKTIELMELSELMAESAILFATNNYIPEHYGHLIYNLFSLYMEAGDWKKAQNQCDKMLNFAIEIEGEKSHAYAIALFNQAMLYAETGKMPYALKKMEESKTVYELAGMKETKEWENCVSMIEEWSTK
ncbi:hypothetical protein EZS27_007260 [termite gut metagenome]|uniref:MalT-like TPR region domain-containing protein n=1 Tax=termite gut metagenome TaxID=433724 RepID=A0A5J4SGA7_9ZZZZ